MIKYSLPKSFWQRRGAKSSRINSSTIQEHLYQKRTTNRVSHNNKMSVKSNLKLTTTINAHIMHQVPDQVNGVDRQADSLPLFYRELI